MHSQLPPKRASAIAMPTMNAALPKSMKAACAQNHSAFWPSLCEAYRPLRCWGMCDGCSVGSFQCGGWELCVGESRDGQTFGACTLQQVVICCWKPVCRSGPGQQAGAHEQPAPTVPVAGQEDARGQQ